MESCKYEGEDRKKYKTENKESGLLPTSKLNENKEKVNKKIKEISNEFPNFTALTEEERLAFFEILNAARKNVENTKESLSPESFDNPQDEFFKYFNGTFLQERDLKKVSSQSNPTFSSTLALERNQEQTLRNSAINPSENLNSNNLFLSNKPFKNDSASLVSLSEDQSFTEKENNPKYGKTTYLSKKNLSYVEIEPCEERKTVFNKDQTKIVNFYLNKKRKPEKKTESNQKSDKTSNQLLLESTASEDTWSEKTYDVSFANFDYDMIPYKKKKHEKNIKNDTILPINKTPKFDSLSSEEKKIFFNVFQEAHENVLQKNLQNQSGILPFETIIKNYVMESSQIPNYNEISIDSQTLRFQKDDNTNIKAKVTLTSTDNQRLEREREEEKYNKMKKELENSKKVEKIEQKESKDTESMNSSLESCEESNESFEKELTDKKELNKLYQAKKKEMEGEIKSTLKELEEKKKADEEECSGDEKDKVEVKDKTKEESKELKSTEVKNLESKNSESKTPETKSPQKKALDMKENESAEWVPIAQKEKPVTKKQQNEKKFLGISRNKKEGKDKDFQKKNLENEQKVSATKQETKKEKEVVQVESLSVHEFKKNKISEKIESDIIVKSSKISEENLLQIEKPTLKVSVHENETIKEGQNIQVENTTEIKEETSTAIREARSSKNIEKKPEKKSDETFLEPESENERNLSKRQIGIKLLSNKVITVSREGQNSIKTDTLLEENHWNRSRDFQDKTNKNVENENEQENENDEKNKIDEKSSKELESSIETNFRCRKVVLVDDGVIEKIKQLIEDLEKNAKAEEDSLSNDYVQLLLDYISYLSRVLCALVNKRDKGFETDFVQVQTSLTSPNTHLKFEEKRKCKPKSKNKQPEGEISKQPLSVSATSLHNKEILLSEKDNKKPKLEEKKSSLLSVHEARSDNEALWAPMFVKPKILPSTKIRLLQDLLKERAKFVEGSVSEFKIVKLPEKDYVPTEKPILRLNIEDEDDAFIEKGAKFSFFKALFKFCRCGKKETADENNILENLKGEAVAVDTSEGQAKNPASATINDSTMEVLKAAERKKVIQKYWKYN